MKDSLHPVRLKLLRAMTSAAFNMCRDAKKVTVGFPVSNRIFITSQNMIIVNEFCGDNQSEIIAEAIFKFLCDFNKIDSGGLPMLSGKIPKKAIAIPWYRKNNKMSFKMVRYLMTYEIFDYFLDYGTGRIFRLRFDLTRFYYLPADFDQRYCPLRVFLTGKERNLSKIAACKSLPVTVINPSPTNRKFILDRLPILDEQYKQTKRRRSLGDLDEGSNLILPEFKEM
ncbi:unnamed protein product [Caenorhabditis sp. 36 PRJEB53466]|nr:unnamed protein product [Caenorhabditis sp. 36 PRJEB53466]